MKDCSNTNKLLISDDNILSLENSIESLKESISQFCMKKNPSELEKDTVYQRK